MVKSISVYFFKKSYIPNQDDEELMNIELPSYPTFQVDDEIDLEVTNQETSVWDVKTISNTFIIRKIEHKFEKHYNGKVIANISNSAFMFVYVDEVWK